MNLRPLDSPHMLHHALACARHGFRVVPLYEPFCGVCSCGNPDCANAGKHPRTPRGVSEATTDEKRIREWWMRWPGANIGLAAGKDLFFVDVDPRHGGDVSIANLESKHGRIETLRTRTGSGGEHLYLAADGKPIRGRVGMLPGIDIKSAGGYVVAPPSLHSSGQRYAWVSGAIPAPTPAWLVELINGREGDNNHREKFNTAAALQGVPEGKRDETIFRLACKLRNADVPFDAAVKLVLEAAANCEPEFPADEARAKVERAYRRYQPGSPQRQPAPPLTDDEIEQLEREAMRSESAEGPAPLTRPQKYSDDALAARFSTRFADELRYTPSWGWLLYDGRRWKRIADVLVMERARPVCREMAQRCLEDAEIPRPSTREGLARSIASAQTVAAVERLARGDTCHFVEASRWDSDLWLLNTPGGTVELRTGELRPHRREDLITKVACATPRGGCDRWLRFLAEVTEGNTELQDYLRRLAGYALVGDPVEECLDFFYGTGGNGKGTFLATLQHVLGDYATTAAAETFVESKSDRHPCDLAKLAGARLVVANEIDENRRWDEARVKSLTGRDVISARFMRQDFFDFVPQFTLIVAGNHKPSLKTVDESIRRRLHLVPFAVTIPRDKQDVNLKTDLRKEADGILAWALRGCREWQARGLDPPEAVLSATTEYLGQEDTFGMWLQECCIAGEGMEERSLYLYESHRSWRSERGERVPSHKTFVRRLTERGYTRSRTVKARMISGLRLTETDRSAAIAVLSQRVRNGREMTADMT